LVIAERTSEIVLSDYLSPDLITFLDVDSRKMALLEMHQLLISHKFVADSSDFIDALIKREEIVSTGIGMGVAIPHAKLDSIDDFFIAIGISRDHGIEWDSLDAIPVRLIFMIGGPPDRQDDYLKLLSALTTLIRDEQRRKEMILAKRPQDIISLLS